MNQNRGEKRTLQGVVSSDKMEKSVRVRVTRMVKHPRYKKFVKRFANYLAHDDKNECQVGDKVVIVESRPYSKTKCWRLRTVVEKAVS